MALNKWYNLLILALCAFATAQLDEINNVKRPIIDRSVVRLTNGLIQGRYVVTKQGTSGYAFMNLPYALPPVGEQRFERFDFAFVRIQ